MSAILTRAAGMSRRLKISLGLFVSLVALAAAGLLGLRFFAAWRERENARALEQAEQELLRPYREDTVGGKTPEETYQLFLDALKKEDIDLAAKYFVLDKQREWRKSLRNTKSTSGLLELVKELSSAPTHWHKDKILSSGNTVAFWYNTNVEATKIEIDGKGFELPEGEETQRIIFERNSSEVWKIRSL